MIFSKCGSFQSPPAEYWYTPPQTGSISERRIERLAGARASPFCVAAERLDDELLEVGASRSLCVPLGPHARRHNALKTSCVSFRASLWSSSALAATIFAGASTDGPGVGSSINASSNDTISSGGRYLRASAESRPSPRYRMVAGQP